MSTATQCSTLLMGFVLPTARQKQAAGANKWTLSSAPVKRSCSLVTSQFHPAFLVAFLPTLWHPFTSTSSSPALKTQAQLSVLKEGPISLSEVFINIWGNYTLVDILSWSRLDAQLMSGGAWRVGKRTGVKETFPINISFHVMKTHLHPLEHLIRSL